METSKGSKKRKLSHLEYHIGDDDDDEEQKIDEFYALIRSMREARDRLMMKNGSGDHDQAILNKDEDQTLQMKQRKKLHDQEKGPLIMNGSAAWKPSFEREDFIEDKNNNINGVDDVGAVLKFKVPNSFTFGTNNNNNSSSSDKIISRAAAAVPDQNQVQTTTITAKEPLDLRLSL